MYYQRLSDEEILSGFREGDARMSMPAPSMPGSMADMAESMACEDMDFIREEIMEMKEQREQNNACIDSAESLPMIFTK